MYAEMWSVEILGSEVAEELDALPADMRARFEHIVNLIAEFGLERVREPHVKHLERKLWEMRLKGRSGIARALYLTVSGKTDRDPAGLSEENPEDAAA